MKHAPEFLKLVESVMPNVKEVTIDGVRAMQNDAAVFTLVDVREDNEWDAGHIPGATHIGRGVIERDIERIVPNKEAALVLYCGGGYRSALAAENLQKMGYTNVLSMAGGFSGWKSKGLPTT